MRTYDRCIEFLEKNGWSKDNTAGDSEYVSMFNHGCISIDINNDEIVFLSDVGDFLHLPLNYYALVGSLFEFRQISVNYISVK